jgi:hypothetical protein
VRLAAGDSIYIDSTMGHAYVAASDKPCRVLAVCSGTESQMIAAVGGRLADPAAVATAPVTPAARRRQRQRRAG